MDLRRELLGTLAFLVVLNVLLAFGSIALFARMGPAIDRILRDNVVSIVAAEEVLSALAMSGPESAPSRERIEQALRTLRGNVTEPEERPLLDAMERDAAAFFAGDAARRGNLVAGVQRILEINRNAMQQVDLEAQRLGSAGAWSAVLAGFASFAVSLWMLARLRGRVVEPLIELYGVLERARRGDRFRRCRIGRSPHEIRRVLDSVNHLLDERQNSTPRESLS